MTELQESINDLKDGQVLQVYFDTIGKEDTDGRKERAGVYSRGAGSG